MTTMSDKVGIEVELLGYNEFIKKLSNIQKETKDRSFNIKVKLTPEKGAIKNLAKQLGTVPVKVRFSVSNDAMKNLRSRVSNIRASVRPTISDANINKFRERLASTTVRPKIVVSREAKSEVQSALNGITITPKVNVNKEAVGEAAGLINGAIGNSRAYVGGKNGMSRLSTYGSALSSFGNSIGGLSRNPLSSMITGMFYQAGFGAFNSIFGQLGNSISRYDTLATFKPTMVSIGEDASEADKAMQELDQSVRGLPTSLNEIVAMAKQFSLTSGSLERGKDVAIAMNNALLASATDESHRAIAIQQIRDVLSGKKLNDREWKSLISAINPALFAVAEELGYKKTDAFAADLAGNKIKNEDFINALIATSTGTGKNVELANISKQTVSGVLRNINIAIARLGEHTLMSLDNILEEHTGKDLLATLRDIGSVIDDIGDDITGWMERNPDKIVEWLDRIRSFDIKGFLTGVGKGLKQMIDFYTLLFKLIPEGKAGYLLVTLSMWGKAVTITGGILKGFGRIFETLPSNGGVKKIKGFFSGLFGKGSVAEDIAESSKKLNWAGKGLASAKMNFQKLFLNLGSIVGIGGAIAAVAGEAWLTFKAIKSLSEIDIDWGKAIAPITGFIGAMIAVGAVAGMLSVAEFPAIGSALVAIGAIGGLITLLTAFTWADSALILKTAQNFEKTLDAIDSIGKKVKTVDFSWGDQLKIDVLFGQLSAIADGAGFWDTLDDRWTSSNISKTATNFLNALKDMATISDVLKSVKRPSAAQLKVLDDIIDLMTDFYQKLYENEYLDTGFLNGDHGKVGKKESKNIKKIVDNFKETIKDIASIVKTMNDMFKEVEKLSSGTQVGLHDEASTKLEYMHLRINEILGVVSEIFEDFRIENRRWNLDSGFGHQNGTNEVENIASIIEGFNTSLNNINSVVGEMLDMYGDLKKINKTITKGDEKGSTKLDSVVTNVKTMLEKMSEVFDEFDKFFTDPLGYTPGGYNTTPTKHYKDTEEMAEVVKGIGDAIESIGKVVDALVNMSDNLAKLSPTKFKSLPHNDIGKIVENIETVLGKLSELADWMDNNYDHDMGDIPSQLLEMSNAIEHIKTASENLIGAGKSLDELGVGKEESFPVAERIKNLITQLGIALGDVKDKGFVAKVTAFKTLIDDLMGILEDFIGSDTTGLDGVETSLSNIGETLDELGKDFEEFFKDQAERFKNAGDNWSRELITGMHLSSVETEIQNSLDTIFGVRNYEFNGWLTGNSYVDGMRNALGQIGSINVPSIQASTVGGNLRSFMTQFRANGGQIFRRRGTDTVPAMLTPGEWVMKRSAVRKYGTSFMNRINNLDIEGAIRSLSMRATANIRPNSSVVNKTTNNTNNAKVTQNIYGNNPNYSFRKANRYVRAL